MGDAARRSTGAAAREDAASPPPIAFLLVLVAITAIGPMAMQIFIPAIPAIQAGFAVSPGTAQLTFSLSTFAMALATLIYGPLSDRFGRKPVVIGGLVVFLVGSVMCAMAPTVGSLILGRIVQAAGGAAGFVLARAIVRDLYGRDRSAEMIAYLTFAMVVVPMVSPAIGGFLTDRLGWRAIFVVGTLVGAATLWGVVARLSETASPDGGQAGMLRGIHRLMKIPAFQGYALQGAFSMSLFFSFLAGAPFIVVQVLGLPATDYGLMFVLVSGSFMVGNFLAARISSRVGLDRMTLIGAVLILVGMLFEILAILTLGLGLLTLFLPMTLIGFAQGLALPNTQAGAVSVEPQLAGAASGLSGFLQMTMAAVFAQLVGVLQDGTAWPTLLAMLFCAAGFLASVLYVVITARGRAGR
jgi:DHA1 family bicyclomycin/chloramphenicol resistance-like MFS transporter